MIAGCYCDVDVEKVIAVSVAVCLLACSFVGVQMPTVEPGATPGSPRTIHCSDSGLLPALDAVGGALAMSGAAVGIFREQFKDSDKPEHFTLFYAGPLVVLAITYWYSAAFGTARVSRCSQLREEAAQVREVVRPIE